MKLNKQQQEEKFRREKNKLFIHQFNPIQIFKHQHLNQFHHHRHRNGQLIDYFFHLH